MSVEKMKVILNDSVENCNPGDTAVIRIHQPSGEVGSVEYVEILKKVKTGYKLELVELVSEEVVRFFNTFGYFLDCTVACYQLSEGDPYRKDYRFHLIDGVLIVSAL